MGTGSPGTDAPRPPLPGDAPAAVLIVDDHAALRTSIRRRLEHDPRYRVCAEAEDGAEALRTVRATRPDLVLLDLTLRDEDGLNVLAAIHGEQPTLPVLILSMHSEEMFAGPALAAGASGYLMKADASECLVEAMDTILSGRVYRGHPRPDPDDAPDRPDPLQPSADYGTPPSDEDGTNHHHRGRTWMHP
jgi:DNA-binding response OmpR family regulator